MKCLVFFILVIVLFFIPDVSVGQTPITEYPTVGEPCPNFLLTDIENYTQRSATLERFKGKWLILDFWTRYCTSCVESFTINDLLQKKFNRKVQFLLVGFNGSTNGESDDNTIRKIYSKFRRKENLSLPVAFDSVLFQKFDIGSCPHLIIIDGEGVVRAITSSVNEDNLNDLINGKNSTFPKTYYRAHGSIENADKTAIISSPNSIKTRTPTIFFQSKICSWDYSITPYLPISMEDSISVGSFQVSSVPLYRLYNYAFMGKASWGLGKLDADFYGRYSIFPILELKDSILFKYDFAKGRNLFCYSFKTLSKSLDTAILKKHIQNDLQSAFGYQVSFEIRKRPYWRLIATEMAHKKLKTHGEKSFLKTDVGLVVKNYPISKLIEKLWVYHQNDVFIDETGITSNVDLTLDCIFTNLEDVKNALNKNGLDLVKGEKEMKVLVIRDPKPEINSN